MGQYLGAFFGTAIVFGIYHDQLIAYTGGNLTVGGEYGTAEIFASYPSKDTTQLTGPATVAIFSIGFSLEEQSIENLCYSDQI